MITNIYCVGRNYVKHAIELGNIVPGEPIIFSKPTSSIVYANGNKIEYPKGDGEIHYEIEVVLKIAKNISDGNFNINDVVSKMALGLDLTKRDVQSTLKAKGYPWLLAKGFKNAAVLTEFWNFPGEQVCRGKEFCLMKNNKVVQAGNISKLIFSFKTLIRYIHKHFGLRKGDIIFTGTPEGVGPINDGDQFELLWDDQLKGSFGVVMD